MTFNTGNPVPSWDPRDLIDNADVVDEYVNSANPTVTNRLAQDRRTLAGIDDIFDASQVAREEAFAVTQADKEDRFLASQADKESRFQAFLLASGYEFLGDYAAGIEFTEYNQIVRDADGEFWRVSGSQALPYTTTGAGVPESGALVSVGDAALRQELAAGDGASKVGYTSAGTGPVTRDVQTKLREWVSVKDFGAVGDGVTDDTAAIQAAVAAANNSPILITDGVYIVTTLSFTDDATFIGYGTIKKKAGTTGHLITSTADLTIIGNITLNQNAANCPNPSASFATDCAISHGGDNVFLDGITSLESVSSNLNLISKKKIVLRNCNVAGGWICVRAITQTDCKVEIIGGSYYSSTEYDNIQILNSTDIVVNGITSYDSALSGIAISNAAGRCRIVNNNCHSNKIGLLGQGGHGIVVSVSCFDFIVSNNNCWNNEQSGITIDTATASIPYFTDAYFTISNNVIDGIGTLNPSGYSPNGLIINKARYGTITGNFIKSTSFGIRLDTTAWLSVTGNTVEDCNDGVFCQTADCNNVIISGNMFSTCIAGAGSVGAVNFITSNKVSFLNNHLTDITGNRNCIRITNSTKCSISNNVIAKDDAGAGQCIWFSGTCTDSYITANKIICDLVGFQYFIVGSGATLTGSTTCNNEIDLPGRTNNNYIYNAPTIIGDQDTVNGFKNYFTVAPTIFTPKTGATAGIAGVLKMWNGSAWV